MVWASLVRCGCVGCWFGNPVRRMGRSWAKRPSPSCGFGFRASGTHQFEKLLRPRCTSWAAPWSS
eukprot:15287729-Alexandrium_andersonii.AAC.1